MEARQAARKAVAAHFAQQRVEMFHLVLDAIQDHAEHFIGGLGKLVEIGHLERLVFLVAPLLEESGKDTLDLFRAAHEAVGHRHGVTVTTGEQRCI